MFDPGCIATSHRQYALARACAIAHARFAGLPTTTAGSRFSNGGFILSRRVRTWTHPVPTSLGCGGPNADVHGRLFKVPRACAIAHAHYIDAPLRIVHLPRQGSSTPAGLEHAPVRPALSMLFQPACVAGSAPARTHPVLWRVRNPDTGPVGPWVRPGSTACGRGTAPGVASSHSLTKI